MERTETLSNLQLELLKLYSTNIEEQDLIKIKAMIANFFAGKAISLADKEWKKKGYTGADAEKWLTESK